MSNERWNPFRDFDNMRQAMDRWMDERMPGNFLNQQNNMLSVALDVHETPTGYALEASLPGVKPEDVDINVERDTVTIRGQTRSTDEQQANKNYLYRERRAGSFFRVIRLPDAVDGEKVEATLENGILRVQLPKLAQTSQRRIQVRGQDSSQPGGNTVNTQPTQINTGSQTSQTGNYPAADQSHDSWPGGTTGKTRQSGESNSPTGRSLSEPGTGNAYGGSSQDSDFSNPS
jgi:HSP20 family protein